MLKLFSHVVLVLTLLSLTHSPSYADGLFDFVGYGKTENGVSAFNQLASVNAENGLSFSLKLNQASHVKITYAFSNQEKVVTNKEYPAGAMINFPESGKSIYLSDPGTHTFTATAENGPESQTKTLALFVSSTADMVTDKSFRMTAGDALPLPNKIDLSGSVNIINAAELKLSDTYQKENVALKTRGAGSTVFKNVADSVVLIATEDTLGSGAVIDKQGTVLTNWHVVDGYDL
jgi:hypothetical protein